MDSSSLKCILKRSIGSIEFKVHFEEWILAGDSSNVKCIFEGDAGF